MSAAATANTITDKTKTAAFSRKFLLKNIVRLLKVKKYEFVWRRVFNQ